MPRSSLDSYAYIHNCKKVNQDVVLELVDQTFPELWRPFERSVDDADRVIQLSADHLLPSQVMDQFVTTNLYELQRRIDNFNEAFTKFSSNLFDIGELKQLVFVLIGLFVFRSRSLEQR